MIYLPKFIFHPCPTVYLLTCSSKYLSKRLPAKVVNSSYFLPTYLPTGLYYISPYIHIYSFPINLLFYLLVSVFLLINLSTCLPVYLSACTLVFLSTSLLVICINISSIEHFKPLHVNFITFFAETPKPLYLLPYKCN